MSKRTKAYSESKLFRNPVDNRKAFYAGWDAALRTVPVCVKCGNKGVEHMSIEAMRIARLVLSDTPTHPINDAKQYQREIDTLEMLDDAIADSEEQKPVAWLSASGIRFDGDIEPRDGSVLKLYTAPPQREWVSLTNEEIDFIFCEPQSEFHSHRFARAIEAKLKEKNT